MKASLQLRLGQQLTMTPQLQQAIRLLQLSTIDLQAELQQALETNPMLELLEDEAENTNNEPEDNWDDVYPSSSNAATSNDSLDYIAQIATSAESLSDHLLWQLRLTPFTTTDQAIATAIIDALDNDGYLHQSLDDIQQALNPYWEVDGAEIEAVLHRIQQFDPIGVAARNLQECLLLQIKNLPKDTANLELAQSLIKSHLELLGQRQFSQLKRKLKIDEPQLIAVVKLIQSLNPRPGSLINQDQAEYIVPDVIVFKKNKCWQVELNPEAIPKVKINAQYASLVKRSDNSTDNTYMRSQLQEARWLLKSLESRNETMLKVATCIVEHQVAFFDYGEEAMKPLVLHDIADAVNMHESTISRVTTQKYMHTPRGILELKYFFSSHVNTQAGGECSSVAIRALIKKLVGAENPNKPLSDNKIASILQEQGIQVARRTIAKYREALNIPSSNERKRLE